MIFVFFHKIQGAFGLLQWHYYSLTFTKTKEELSCLYGLVKVCPSHNYLHSLAGRFTPNVWVDQSPLWPRQGTSGVVLIFLFWVTQTWINKFVPSHTQTQYLLYKILHISILFYIHSTSKSSRNKCVGPDIWTTWCSEVNCPTLAPHFYVWSW